MGEIDAASTEDTTDSVQPPTPDDNLQAVALLLAGLVAAKVRCECRSGRGRRACTQVSNDSGEP